jgi:hypothetical protein
MSGAGSKSGVFAVFSTEATRFHGLMPSCAAQYAGPWRSIIGLGEPQCLFAAWGLNPP